MRNRSLPGRHITDCQMRLYMSFRQAETPSVATAKAGCKEHCQMRQQRFRRLELQFGLAWMAEFLECVTAAAIVGLHEINRLQEAEEKGRLMGATARSRLPKAVDAVLRAHIVTPASLAGSIRVTPQAALGLLRQLTAVGIGSGSNRARVVAGCGGPFRSSSPGQLTVCQVLNSMPTIRDPPPCGHPTHADNPRRVQCNCWC
jgi:hypothetical protein